MTAPDAQNIFDPGFTAQVLWVGTNGAHSAANWVEVGFTRGYQGHDVYTYYTAHGEGGGSSYGEHRITEVTGALGTTHRLSSFVDALSTAYWAAIDGTAYWSWSNKLPPTVDWSMGLEATCGDSAKVNRTYVSANQYRQRYSGGGTWANATTATVKNFQGSTFGGGFAWCSYPLTFRYFLRSDIDQTVCE